MASIKRLVPREHVRAHPERYWGGKKTPDVRDVNAAIVEQLQQDGFSGIETFSRGGWQFVTCPLAWASYIDANFLGIAWVFDKGIGFPQAGPKALRAEWFVVTAAQSVRVWVGGELAYSNGEANGAPDFGAIPNFRDCVCIGYQLMEPEPKRSGSPEAGQS